ncbi:MAG: DUF839 domain-containing protein [Cellvibrio sp.]|nr:DUF839 domain-containing protein [Cellvibrio sp.]
MQLTRRHFLRNATAATLAMTGFHLSAQAQVYALDPERGIDPFGKLIADPKGILNLPAGFRYQIIRQTGQAMSDGLITPGIPDGMAAFPVAGKPNQCLLVCNHEQDSSPGQIDAFGGDKKLALQICQDKAFDFYQDGMPANGGTTTLLYDLRQQKLVSSHLSLIGTSRNCSGGATPWGSWLSCEETIYVKKQGFNKDHGYVFEVPATLSGLHKAEPLYDMGRFVHEACAVDEQTGIIYMTEDLADGLFYRFIPNKPGQLSAGGKLQALAIKDWISADTRNKKSSKKIIGYQDKLATEWIDLDEVRSPNGDLNRRGHNQGAAIFERGEGLVFAKQGRQKSFYFAATTGGNAELGQIWQYIPSPFEGTKDEVKNPGSLQLIYESIDRAYMEASDNLTVAPWGDILICEDSYSGAKDQINYLRGMTPEGKIYTLAMNADKQQGEFCGACFSPDGNTLFVNIQHPGYTIAIQGPWPKVKLS